MKKLQVMICILLVLTLLATSLVGCAKAPTLTVSQPKHGATLTSSPVVVKGIVSDAKATVRINDVKVSVSKTGSFSKKVALKEGKNTIKVWAIRSKKSTSKTLTVTYTPPLLLEITSPEAGVTLTDSLIILSGTVSNPKATITVNDAEVEVAEDGTFSTDVELTEGENTIKVVATRGDEVVTETITVTYTPSE